jgi:adenosylcobinamide-GDP ribazoletransferase
VSRAVRPFDMIGWIITVLVLGLLYLPLAIAPLLIVSLALWFRRKLGGMTGDVHGAGIELTETGLLVATLLYLAP